MKLFDEQRKGAIIKQTDWDSSKERAKLSQDIDAHIADVRAARLSDLTAQYESKVKAALYGPVEALLEGAAEDTWPAIRKLLRNETKTAVSEFSDALSGFEMDEDAKKNLLLTLENFARDVVEGKAKEEAGKVLHSMKERFTTVFNHDNDLMPRVWTGKEDIRAINKTARTSSLKLLAVLAAIRFEDYKDKIEDILLLAFADPTKGANKSSSSQDPLATSKWGQIPASKTLITPVQCRSLWSQFQKETEYAVSQAISAQESFTRAFEEKYQDLDTRPVDDPSLWEVVMPRKKGRIFGFGTSHNPMFAMTGTPSTLSNGQSYHFAPTPEVTQLQEALQAEREKREELERRSQELEQRSAEEIQSLQQRQATTENIVNQLLVQLRPNSDGPPLP